MLAGVFLFPAVAPGHNMFSLSCFFWLRVGARFLGVFADPSRARPPRRLLGARGRNGRAVERGQRRSRKDE